ncbi:SpoIIE family protein phosphatase [Kitasatospora sp. NBC_01287]|uniref:SpoIIE family protein phosphatase n=1 Tax=Kitasatospora sp. NBC_01287 TaxID=2903573 RepID=UPI002251B953|nr:SpoIIE family protein phosphatase [Kitasatospora sp. NBC_01287]MCX4751569.1 SpoIIE family protein phosphatase [Kitasatospora sp. NBC_01287]
MSVSDAAGAHEPAEPPGAPGAAAGERLGRARGGPSEPGGLLDVLGVAAAVLDAQGRIVLWSPQAQQLFGWSAEEALGRFAAPLLVAEEHVDLILAVFARVMTEGGTWAGVFPVRHKDGSTRPVEFRNMRLQDRHGDWFALGLATDEAVLRGVERDLALSVRLVAQSPIGLAVLDSDLRYVLVNPALERIDALPADQHLGRTVREALPFLDVEAVESAMRQVLASGTALVDQFTVGRTRAAPEAEHAWRASYFRLEDPAGRVIGLATSVVDVTDQHRAATEATAARRRLALIARASVRIGTTLDLDRTARELADFVVADRPGLADIAAVDVLDSVLTRRQAAGAPAGTPAEAAPRTFRALAVAASHPDEEAVRAADPTGEIASYGADRLVTRCVTGGRPVLVPRVRAADLPHIARSPQAAAVLARAGLHSYLAVPLIARGEVLGALDLKRTRNPLPFDEDDVLLAGELAARAAVAIDNARWYQSQRHAALTLQRHLLPHQPPQPVGLTVAYRYQPAAAAGEVGGDWFDVIPASGERTALVVGDVMGSGINAAATMGQLRTATRTLAGLDLDPAEVLHHLDRITQGLEETIATCVYAVLDPHRGRLRIATAGHLPPVLVGTGRAPLLLELPTGAPLGVGGVPFEATTLGLAPEDRLVLYTDGLVETRDQAIDERLRTLLDLLAGPRLALEPTCDRLLTALRHPDDPDDVALLIAQVEPVGPVGPVGPVEPRESGAPGAPGEPGE